MSAGRASLIGVLGALGFVLVGAWGVVNLSEGDWFIGVAMVASAVGGLWSLAVRMLRERRRPPRGPLPPGNTAVGQALPTPRAIRVRRAAVLRWS